MTASILDLRFTERIPPPVKKRRVLLVDSSRAKRDLRAEIMRKLGMDVDCAEDISEARTWWRADLYNLVLISAENEHGRRDRFCEDIRGAVPPQQMAFLVGKPEYLANSPIPDAAPILSEVGDPALLEDLASTPGHAPGKSLLDETLVVASSEFGRTTYVNNAAGRDHYRAGGIWATPHY